MDCCFRIDPEGQPVLSEGVRPMKKALTAASLVIGLFAIASALAGENLKSGPQVGEKVPGPFEPLNLTGDKAGEKACLFCKNGSHPVAMIFARDISEPLT